MRRLYVYNVGWLPRLLLATALFNAATSVIRPMLSYRTLALGGDAVDIGLIAAASAVVQFVAAVPVGRLVDRSGPRWFVPGGLAAMAAAGVLLVGTGHVWQLATLSAVLGLGGIVHIVGVHALLAGGATEVDHDRGFARLIVAVSVGQFVGPVLGGFIAEQSGTVRGVPETAWSLVAAAGMLVVGATVVLRLPGTPERAAAARGRRSQPGETSVLGIIRTEGFPRVVFASLAVVVSVELLAVYLPLLGQERGISAGAVGALLGLRAGASVASRFAIAALVRRLGRRWLVAASTLGAGTAVLLVPVLADQILALGVLMLVIGFFLGLGQPLTMTWVVLLVVSHVRATALALRLTANRLGQTAVPPAAGLVAGPAGAAGAFVLLGVLLGAACVAVASIREPRWPPS